MAFISSMEVLFLLMVATLGLVFARPLRAGVRRLVAWRATPGLGYDLLVTALDWAAGLCAGGLSLGLVLATHAHDPAALDLNGPASAIVLAVTSLFAIPVLAGPYIDLLAWIRVHVRLAHRAAAGTARDTGTHRHTEA